MGTNWNVTNSPDQTTQKTNTLSECNQCDHCCRYDYGPVHRQVQVQGSEHEGSCAGAARSPR